MPRKVVLVKLGGSLLTNKSKPFSERREVISDLVGQIKRAHGKNGKLIVVGHGGGSYPHVPAEKYKTIEGNINGQSVYGSGVVEDAAAQLNRIVVGEFLKQKLPAVSFSPASFLVSSNKKEKVFFSEPFLQMLKLRMIPVVYGDVVMDEKLGFTIWSTERVLNLLAEKFLDNGLVVEKIIHCGEPDGFLVEDKVIKKINRDNFDGLKKHVKTTEGFDVTGGMMHKVEEALETADKGLDTYIIGGNHGGNLYRAIVGENFLGTKISK